MSHILTDISDGVLTLTFNRPDKKNALTQAMYATLADTLEAAAVDSTVRAILLTGAGGVFTSGNDVQDFLMNPVKGENAPVLRFLRAIATQPKPMIAAVAGNAVGVGMTMLFHCDLVYAADNAKLSVPFVNLALVPEAASSLLIPKVVGHHRAAELFLFGEPIDAATAKEWGIVNQIFSGADLAAEARARAMKIAAKAPASVRLIKELMKAPKTTTLEQMLVEGAHFQTQLVSAEAREAFTAFLEKRPPKFG